MTYLFADKVYLTLLDSAINLIKPLLLNGFLYCF